MIAKCFIEKKRQLRVTACYPHRNKVVILAAFIVFAGGGAAFGQVCNFPAPVCPGAATCPAGCTLDDTTTPACDTSLEHGQGGTAACQNRCVGETLACTGTTAYVDQLQDVIRLEEAFNTVDGTVRSPAAGNLPIIKVFFNAVCTNSGGVCNPATGANCVFPCLVGPGGSVYADPSTGLTLPGLAGSGQVRVADNQYVIQPGDVGNLGNTFTFVGTDLCTSCCSNCPTTCDSATASSNTVVPNCNDGDPCTVDCCILGVCTNPSDCLTNNSCRGTDGIVRDIPPITCNDANTCTTDSCVNDTNPATGCCTTAPIFCPAPPVCFTQGPCNPATGCPAPVSDCVTNPALCNDGNACTRDICDASAPGCCRYEDIPCPAPPVCFTRGPCDPVTGCPAPVSDCVTNPALCNDNNACTRDICDVSAPGCCRYEDIPCPAPPVCFTRGPCNPATGCPPIVSDCVTNPALCEDGDPCTEDICDVSAPGCCVNTPICLCGDGEIDPTEACDGASRAPGVVCTDACDAACTCCGDRVRQAEEVCDGTQFEPGAPDSHGPCRADCTYCGDGDMNGDEECDDGNNIDTDTCKNDCTLPQAEETCRTPGFWGTHACGANGVNCEKDRSRNLTLAALNACGGCAEICGDIIDTTVLNDSDSALEAICVSPQGTQVRQLARQLTSAALNCCISGSTASCGGISVEPFFTACNAACAAGNVMATVNSQKVNCINIIDDFNNGRISDCHGRNVGLCSNGAICTEQVPCITGACGPHGPAGSSNACSAARGNQCYVIGTTDCAGADDSNASQSCPD